jgi:hypothetical protein
VIEDANIYKEVEYKGKRGLIRDLLLKVKVNGERIFTGVEQEKGRKVNCMYLLMTPNKRFLAQD